MSAKLLLAHLERLASAPENIDNLRRYALGLAVSGRLVARHVDDEPASLLLQAIAAKRKELLSSGSLRAKRANYGALTAGDTFELPPQWVRTTIDETCELRTGATPSRDRADFFGGEIPWLVSGDVNKGEIVECEGRITQLGMNSSNCKWLPAGAVLIALNGQGKTRGTVALLRMAATCSQSLVAIVPLRDDCLLSEYLYWNLRSRYRHLRLLTGEEGDRRGLNMRIISRLTLPLPPLAEQHRIVAKVTEMMALVDQLEDAQMKRETQRNALRSASVRRLVSSGDNWSQDARRFLETSPRMVTRPEHLEEVRQMILNLAVRGRLAPQDASDQPATQLLDVVSREAERVQSSRFRRNVDPVSSVGMPLPSGWASTTLAALAASIDYGTSERASLDKNGVAVLRMSNIVRGALSFQDLKYLPSGRVDDRLLLEPGDLLFNRTNSAELVGKNAVFNGWPDPVTFASYLIRVRPLPSSDMRWISVVLRSDLGRQYLSSVQSQQTGQANISGTKLARAPIPLPPLAEQRRIIARVHELSQVCDQLSLALATSVAVRERSLSALLRDGLD